MTALTAFTREELAGQDLFTLVMPDAEPATLDQIRASRQHSTPFHGRIRITRKDGSTFWTFLSLHPVQDSSGQVPHFACVFRGISPPANLIGLEQAFLLDPLTGLPNSLFVNEHLSKAIARADRDGTLLAVGVLDLDDFDSVRETLGDEAGDRLLQNMSERLRGLLRANDFVARLGEDEFAVVIGDFDPSRVREQIPIFLDRLHQAVERPFEVAQGWNVTLKTSVGLALYPVDGEDADRLLRQANASKVSTRGGDRPRRGQNGHSSLESGEMDPFDAYGPEAAALLLRHRDRFDAVTRLYVESFNRYLDTDPESSGELSSQSDQERERLKVSQARHLAFLFDPETTQTLLFEGGETLGSTYALSGISGGQMTHGTGLYTQILTEHLGQEFLAGKDRYRILLIATHRLQEDLKAQLRGEAQAIATYFRTFSSPLPPPASHWGTVRSQELGRLGSLPGIQSVLLLRPDSEGTFFVEESGGPEGATIASFFQSPGYRVSLESDRSMDQSVLSRVWRTQRSEIIASVAKDPDHPWFSVNQTARIRSLLEIAVSDASGRPVAVLGLGGAYPNQFGSAWMKLFAKTAAYRWSQLWSICNNPLGALDVHSSTYYRTELFSGGLTLEMQPVVNLKTGHPEKVEALARLTLPNGEVVPPGNFLPLLGHSELDRLFRRGLDMSLEWVSRWESLGFSIGVSVNLPPGTLHNPSCFQWVEKALLRHALPPSRLTLEILENQEIFRPEQHQTILHLVNLGVRIAMDDVGSGYSSLERFSLLPFDTIKVDQKLLSRIRTIPLETMGMIWAIIQIGREFGREVVVEGLEDDGMIETTMLLGAGFGQGFRIARPMTADLIPSWAQSFSFPASSKKVTTYLGALAFHWQILHSSPVQTTILPPLDECPLTAFLIEKNLGGSEPAHWHRMIHEKGENQASSNRKLIAWLVERIKEERTP
jgi:diguanylate cyclase (GGDEF)-like protein